MIPLSKKQRISLLIAGVVLFILIPIVAFIIQEKNASLEVSKVEGYANQSPIRGLVTLSNAQTYASNLSPVFIKSAERKLSDQEKGSNDTTATIRDNSFKKELSNGYTNLEYLVDIASTKHTYRLIQTIDGPDSFRATLLLCPEPDELIYGAFECSDFRSEE